MNEDVFPAYNVDFQYRASFQGCMVYEWLTTILQQSFEDSFIQFGFPGGGEKHLYTYILKTGDQRS